MQPDPNEQPELLFPPSSSPWEQEPEVEELPSLPELESEEPAPGPEPAAPAVPIHEVEPLFLSQILEPPPGPEPLFIQKRAAPAVVPQAQPPEAPPPEQAAPARPKVEVRVRQPEPAPEPEPEPAPPPPAQPPPPSFWATLGEAAVPFARKWRTELGIAAGFVAILAGPFLLRPADSTAPSHYDRRLVIMTPHPDQIRDEFGRAFARYWKETKHETLAIDWRVAGTSELATLINSDFRNAFKHYWVETVGQPHPGEAMGTFLNPKAPPSDRPRAEFLKSNVSIGVDLFFGGGPHDFQSLADAGILVAADAKTGCGLAALSKRHPEWFSEEGIPEKVSGQAFRDKDMRWCGTCLSTFGIVYNRDVLKRLGIDKEPRTWEDLTDPRLLGQISLADPSKSGSATQAFEMIIQQQMQLAVARIKAHPGPLRKPADIEAAGVRAGWLAGLRLIQNISGNARSFVDASPKTNRDVAQGSAAAGMCIDFYGRSTEEIVRQPDGTTRIGFVSPAGGTALTVDPIGMMRGAPEPQAAEAFMEFVLSDRGQRLWDFRTGTPGGPERTPLRRLPIREDFYTEENLKHMSDAAEEPYLRAQSFIYHPEWTAGMFNSLRFIIRLVCVDSHDELQKAWSMLARQHNPPRASEIFHQLAIVDYDAARGDINRILTSKDKALQVREARRITDAFRHQYSQALDFARAEK